MQSLREYHRKHPGERIEELKIDVLASTPLTLGSLHTERLLDQLAEKEHERAAAQASADAVVASTLPPKMVAPVAESTSTPKDFRVDSAAPSRRKDEREIGGGRGHKAFG